MNRILNLLLIAAIGMLTSCGAEGDALGPNDSSGSTGTGGSLARFTISCGHLYTIDDESLYVFSLNNGEEPKLVTTMKIGNGIETIFPYDNHLFIGSATGMFIYSLANCTRPTYLSQYEHSFGCDPVVVENDTAYVTIRNGTSCRTTFEANELDILDVSDKSRPELIQAYPVEEPWGLGIDNRVLFLCHGSRGFGIYDVNDPFNMITLKLYENIQAYDVIPMQGNLMTIAEDGLYQYDYNDLDNLKLLSKISVER